MIGGNTLFSLGSSNGLFTLRPGSQAVTWNGLELRLGFVPQLIDGQPFVHTVDLHKTIAPLLDQTSPPLGRW
jgi:hypothetical protein